MRMMVVESTVEAEEADIADESQRDCQHKGDDVEVGLVVADLVDVEVAQEEVEEADREDAVGDPGAQDVGVGHVHDQVLPRLAANFGCEFLHPWSAKGLLLATEADVVGHIEDAEDRVDHSERDQRKHDPGGDESIPEHLVRHCEHCHPAKAPKNEENAFGDTHAS